MGVELGVFLDSLKPPIVVVDQEGAVVTGNDKVRELLQKKLSDIEGYKGGDVFECAYARLPEGCGNTVHCSGCTIRRTVMETHETGKGFLRVPATLKRYAPLDTIDIKLLISTERIGDVVLLRIDEMEAEDASQPQAESDGGTNSLNRCG
jgi:PAS domain-containing protein